MAKEFRVSITEGKTTETVVADTPEEAIEKYLKQLVITAYDDNTKDLVDYSLDSRLVLNKVEQ